MMKLELGLKEIILLAVVAATTVAAATLIKQGQLAVIKIRVAPPSANITTCTIDLGTIVSGGNKTGSGTAKIITNFNNASLTFTIGSVPDFVESYTVKIYLNNKLIALLSPGNTTAHYALASPGTYTFTITANVKVKEVTSSVSGQIVVNVIVEKP